MKKKQYHWTIPLTGAVLFTTAVSAEQDINTYLQSTNHVTLSLRFGLNIHASFKGMGNGFFLPGSIPGNGQLTPVGDPYNYVNGYVYPNGNETTVLGVSGYYGFISENQVNTPQALALGILQSVSFYNQTVTGIPSETSGDNHDSNPGFVLTYDCELGKKENWCNLHYGIEGAVNYMKLSLNNSSTSSSTVTTVTTIYQFAPGTTAPFSPVLGVPGGAGYNQIGIPPSQGGFYPTTTLPASTSSGTFLSQDQFSGDLWGFRLGPYLDFPMSEKWSLHLSGGLAVGLLDDNEAWQQSLNTGAGTFTASGQGADFRTLWGYYVSLDAAYQINKRWGVEGGVQYEDIGQYSHSFSGRTVQLDLSQSLFVQVGVSYSF